MEMNLPSARIHPLMAGAAVSVMLVSMLGMAAVTGVLPNSHGTVAPVASITTPAALPMAASVATAAATPVQYVAPAPLDVAPIVHHKRVVHHQRAVHHAAPTYSQSEREPAPQYAQASPNYNQQYQQPVQQPIQQPAAQHSPVGIAAGAVIGGLLGNQVGGGNGRTLATVAAAVGGGYLGDVVGKKYGY